MGTPRHPASSSTFRTVALVTSTVAAALFLLSAAAVARYGDRARLHGWTAARERGETIVVRVDPAGPAHGILQPGDAIVAWNVGADGAFLVMELVRGRTLRREIDHRGHLPAGLAAMWFEQICEGVAAAHEQHVVHRDLKPENVLIAATATGGEVVKVLDFGLAKVRTASDDTNGFTSPGVVMGTAGYMAPEQLMGAEVDHRVDVFAIGVMVAESIVGQRPFRGRSYSELLASISSGPVALGGEGQERRRLESILRRATASNPAMRYASIAALASDLIPALRALPAAVSDPDALTAWGS